MDPATASILTAIISAIASVAVAIITTREKISPHAIDRSPANASSLVDTPQSINVPPGIETANLVSKSNSRSSYRVFRAVGWFLVGLLYLMSLSMFFFLYILVKEDGFFGADGSITAGIGVAGASFVFVAYFAQRRLQRQH